MGRADGGAAAAGDGGAIIDGETATKIFTGIFAFNGLVKHDVETGTETFWHAPEGTFVSETVVAPRLGSTAEDDAYLLTFSCDMVNDESHCEIFDADDPTVGPIARVKLPERISSGTHATWAPASQLT
mgnify:CR=1 FL=1